MISIYQICPHEKIISLRFFMGEGIVGSSLDQREICYIKDKGHLNSEFNANQKLPRFLPWKFIRVYGKNLGNFWLEFWEKR
jgi:hypothetical protein